MNTTKLLHLVFLINTLEDTDQKDLKISLPHFFPGHGQPRYKSAYFPCHHFIPKLSSHPCEKGRKQSGMELLTARGVSGHKSCTYKLRGKR